MNTRRRFLRTLAGMPLARLGVGAVGATTISAWAASPAGEPPNTDETGEKDEGRTAEAESSAKAEKSDAYLDDRAHERTPRRHDSRARAARAPARTGCSQH